MEEGYAYGTDVKIVQKMMCIASLCYRLHRLLSIAIAAADSDKRAHVASWHVHCAGVGVAISSFHRLYAHVFPSPF